MNVYSEHFFERQGAGSLASARVIVPIVLRYIEPRSVVDVGCGIGGWLSVFREQGVEDIRGIDGPWVKRTQLLIPPDRFSGVNLESLTKLQGSADLAVSLEVAEHLPERAADQFIAALVRLAPVILFSAAIPFQGGTHHENERWPAYWAKKFKEHGYVSVDCIRREVWENPQVEFWYAQNMFFYVRESLLPKFPKLKALHDAGLGGTPPLVHPQKFIYVAERYDKVRRILELIPSPLRRLAVAIARKLDPPR